MLAPDARAAALATIDAARVANAHFRASNPPPLTTATGGSGADAWPGPSDIALKVIMERDTGGMIGLAKLGQTMLQAALMSGWDDAVYMLLMEGLTPNDMSLRQAKGFLDKGKIEAATYDAVLAAASDDVVRMAGLSR